MAETFTMLGGRNRVSVSAGLWWQPLSRNGYRDQCLTPSIRICHDMQRQILTLILQALTITVVPLPDGYRHEDWSAC